MSDFISASAQTGRSVTLVGMLVNSLLIALKFLTGIFGLSQALIADAVHSVSDLFTDTVVLLAIRIGRRPPDADHHFGHARIETLASVIVGLSLAATALYLAFEAVLNIYQHTEYHPTGLALIGAGASIFLKEALYHYTAYIGRRIKSQLIITNAWHHRSDALSSVAVLAGVAGAQIKPSWYILDAFATLIVSFLIVKVSLDILKKTLREISDAAPSPEIVDKIKECSLTIDGVINTHDLRIRTLGGLFQMEIHIVVDGTLTVIEGHQIAKEVENCLNREIKDIDKVIVHVDPAGQRKG